MLYYVVFTLMMTAVAVKGSFLINAFSVSLGKDRQNINASAAFMFDQVNYNYEGAYDVSTGLYDARFTGLYMFAFDIGHRGKGNMYAQLYHKNHTSSEIAVKSSAYVEGKAMHHFAQGGNTVIMWVRRHDKVWLQIEQTYGSTMIGFNKMSSFSGFRISDL